MKKQASIPTLLEIALVLGTTSLTACPGEGGQDGDGGSETSTTTDTPPVGTDTSTTTDGDDVVDPDTSSGSSDGADTTTGGEDEFEFPTDPYDAYTQIDRHGAVEAGTAGILASAGLGFGGEDLSLRDAYNASNPMEDADGIWLDEIVASVTFFHDALDDDILGIPLTPATVNVAIQQAQPVIVPDTIKYDPSQPTGYPNGRRLEDPVVDITLAAVLLDLGEHPLTTFAEFPLNPPENDVPFQAEFPYLAAPHAPK